MWLTIFGLLFVLSLILVGLERRDNIRARRDTPNYRYYWLPLVGLRTAMIVATISVAPSFWIGLLVLIYFVGAAVILVPSTAALISLLVYCPRTESRGGRIAFRGLSLALAVVIGLVVYHVWKKTSIEVDKPQRYAFEFISVGPNSSRA